MTAAGQPSVSYSYDNDNRLTQISQGSSTVGFSYDNGGRRISLTLPNGVTVSYNYDQASELTGITYALGSTTLGNLTYGYDADGRRTTVGGTDAATGLPQALSSATYDAANELTKWGGTKLSYDADGNLTSDGTNSYTWDARNQLASINSGAYSFEYDAFGRRIGDSGTGYLYDGPNVIQEVAGGSPIASRLTGGVDEFFSLSNSNGTFYPLTDALGSTIALTDSTGAVQTQYTYEPFGNTTVSGPAEGNSFEYTGRENDGTGLYYYRARYYSPVYQRFISEDPMGLGGGFNLYAYVGNEPVELQDAFGLHPTKPQWWPPFVPYWNPWGGNPPIAPPQPSSPNHAPPYTPNPKDFLPHAPAQDCRLLTDMELAGDAFDFADTSSAAAQALNPEGSVPDFSGPGEPASRLPSYGLEKILAFESGCQ